MISLSSALAGPLDFRGGLLLLFGLKFSVEVPMQESPNEFVPPKPPKSFRVVIELFKSAKRLDNVLLAALKAQNENLDLREITRTKFKDLFTSGRIQIKGQKAGPSSAIAKGVTYVDILGY
jgi:hypothetical protein